MSLNWDLTKIEDYETKCWVDQDDGDKRLSYVTEGLIWMCMTIDMNGITEKNAAEFWRRTMLFEQCVGPMLSNGTQHRYYTEQDIKDHIGLSTNVATRTKVQFRTKLERMAEREANLQASRRAREGDKLTLEQAAAAITA